jgi:hypothetical protein
VRVGGGLPGRYRSGGFGAISSLDSTARSICSLSASGWVAWASTLASGSEPISAPTACDGYRGLLYVTRNGCHFRSKRGNILKRFEELCLSMAPTSQPSERPAIPGRFIPSVRGSRALAGTRSGRRYRQALAQGSGVEGHGGSPPAQVEVFAQPLSHQRRHRYHCRATARVGANDFAEPMQ